MNVAVSEASRAFEGLLPGQRVRLRRLVGDRLHSGTSVADLVLVCWEFFRDLPPTAPCLQVEAERQLLQLEHDRQGLRQVSGLYTEWPAIDKAQAALRALNIKIEQTRERIPVERAERLRQLAQGFVQWLIDQKRIVVDDSGHTVARGPEWPMS